MKHMVITIGAFILCVWCLEAVGYVLLTPDPGRPPVRDLPLLKHMGSMLYGASYVLSLLRAPLGLLPYLVKLWMQLGLRLRYEARRTNYRREALNMLCEVANLAATWALVRWLVGPACLQWWIVLCYLPVWAECIRLLAERIPILFSAAWQLAPHRQFARWSQRRGLCRRWSVLACYCHYYSLDDAQRAAYVLDALKRRSANDPEISQRLAYLHAFRIVPQQQGLRGGLVRDVACGEVFIHAVWTGDPFLLIGMALRRAPWPFDPRYLRRPFYYMSEANRVTSLFVLRHAHYSLPYAVFQFGHEIRVARLHCFYVLLRWLGADIERKVWADGTFQNDQCIDWLKRHPGRAGEAMEARPLYNDEEVYAELASTVAAGTLPSAQKIAERYVYPLRYVEEVLLPEVKRRQEEKQHEFYPAQHA
jgi:hypothetical protein